MKPLYRMKKRSKAFCKRKTEVEENGMSIVRRIKRMLFGTFKEAKQSGMIVEEGVSIVGGGKLWK